MTSAHPFCDAVLSVPEAVVRVLEEAGIEFVFGMPGGNAMMIFDALHDRRKSVRTVLVRHETHAAVMAEVYGRLTGKPGVALGQGAFMLAGAGLGVLEAHCGCSPMLLMCDMTDNAPYSHHAPYQVGTGHYGTWDARTSFSGFTKATFTATDAAEAVQLTQFAVKHALSGERGPVCLLYHSSALKGVAGPESLPRLYATAPYIAAAPPAPDGAAVSAAAKALKKAKAPVILAGNGVRIAGARAELVALAELLGAPVATTASGKGVFPENHPLALGLFGNFGLPAANALVGDSDVVLAVGTKLAPSDTINEHPALLDPTRQVIIHADIEPRNAAWTFPCEHVLAGDAGTALWALAREVAQAGAPGARTLASRKKRVADARKKHGFFDAPEFTSNETPILPQRVARAMRNALPDDAIVCCDAGENRLFMMHFFQTRPGGEFLQPGATGGMGYGIPAALAAKLVHPKRAAVAVCGDGGFAMSMNGLLTAREEGIPIVVVIMNNSALGWVKHGQKDRPIASEFAETDLSAVARALGCRAERVTEPGDLEGAIRRAVASGEPYVLDCVTSMKVSYESVMSPLITVSYGGVKK